MTTKVLSVATGVVLLGVLASVPACSKDSPQPAPTAASSSTAAPTSTTPSTSTKTTSTTVTPTSSAAPAASNAFIGEWVGHTRTMTVRADGTAVIQINDGAVDGETWNAQWAPIPAGLAFTFTTLTGKTGNGLGDAFAPGMIWDAALEQQDDGTIMHFVKQGEQFSDDTGFFWCSASGKPGYSHNCGA
ncbi:hypothetical protein EV580_5994 [Mycobacterium sp. BK086]|nr:hypothetical protein EV580_5994 [Mycobacterium sp. BK086]